MTAALEEMIDRQRQRVADTLEFRAATADAPRRTDALNASMLAYQRQKAVLDDLVARRDARAAAIASHEKATQDHADDLVMLTDELQERRRALGDRVTAAIQALGDAWDAAAQFDELLAQRSKDLQAAGLPANYRPGTSEQVKFTDGGGQGGSYHPHLVLAGHEWQVVYPQGVVSYVEHAVLASRRYVHPQKFAALGELLDPVVRRPAPVPPPPPAARPQSRMELWAQ
jgi:hypothetical protein